MKTLLIACIIMSALAFTRTQELIGRWESKSGTGTITGVVFKPDNTFEGYVNKKPFVSGTYTYTSQDSIFTFTDNGCNGVMGTYKINFYANGDSMRFAPIDDECIERKEGMQRLNMGKVK